MDVFLIPTATPGRYELYYEAPDRDIIEPVEGTGLISRFRRRFAEALREAEEWRHRGQSEEHPPASGIMARARRRIMSFIVQRIAEQRLLWHLRKAVDVCAQIPGDLNEEDVRTIIRTMLKKDSDHHFKWIWLDLFFLLLCAPLTVIPGPNLPAFYFTFQVVGHYLSYRGAQQGLLRVKWDIRQNTALTELRTLVASQGPHRARRLHELAERLRLPHLPTFVEQVAAPTA